MHMYKRHGAKKYTNKQVEGLIEKRMVELITKNGKPLSGVIEIISFLKTKNKKIGLATSSSFVLIKAVLDTLGCSEDLLHTKDGTSLLWKCNLSSLDF